MFCALMEMQSTADYHMWPTLISKLKNPIQHQHLQFVNKQ